MRGLRWQLHDVCQHDDVLAVRDGRSGAARRYVVRVDVPDGLLLERNVLPGVLVDVRGLQRLWRVCLHLLQRRWEPAVPVERRVRELVSVWDVPVWQHVPVLLEQLRHVLWIVYVVHVLLVWSSACAEQRHVRVDVPVRDVCERDVLHAVPFGDVRRLLHRVLVRDRRVLQLWVHWRRLVHLCDWVHAGECWVCVQHVRERVLPERDAVPVVRERLRDVQQLFVVLCLLWVSAGAARGRVLRLWLRERLLLERDQLCCLLVDVRDLHIGGVLQQLQLDVGDAVLQQRRVRERLPERDISQRQHVPCVRQQLRHVQRDVDGVHVVPGERGA